MDYQTGLQEKILVARDRSQSRGGVEGWVMGAKIVETLLHISSPVATCGIRFAYSLKGVLSDRTRQPSIVLEYMILHRKCVDIVHFAVCCHLRTRTLKTYCPNDLVDIVCIWAALRSANVTREFFFPGPLLLFFSGKRFQRPWPVVFLCL